MKFSFLKSIVLGSLFCVSAQYTFAQDLYLFSTTFVAKSDEDYQRNEPVRQAFEDVMILHGAEESETMGTLFLIGISEVNEQGLFALSITALNKLPEKVIESGKLGQVFYSALNEPNLQMLTEDAVYIREKISEDYIRQFYSIGDNWTILTDNISVDQDLKLVVSEILKK